MPSIVIFIIIVFVLTAIGKSKGKNGQKSAAGNRNNAPYNGSRQSGGSPSPGPQAPQNTASAGHYVNSSGSMGGTVYSQKTVNVVPNRESNPMYRMNTGNHGDSCNTGYLLNERSSFDESAHPKLGYDRGITARCHNDWDIIPQGYKVIKCCYCGAGNEVPVRKNGEYKCYFCWKKL